MSDVYSYSITQKALHWIVALLFVAMIPAGFIFTDFDNRDAIEATFGAGSFDRFYNMHKSVGFLVLGLMLLRIIVKVVMPKPPYAQPLAPAQRMASGIVHGLIYVLLIVVPVLGWAGVSAFPAPLPVFGFFDMPNLVGPDRELSRTLLDGHGLAVRLLIALAVVHIAAALYHGIVKRDGVLSRMVR
ncbi:cytochrome b [Pontivivens ytuae]|uniref:Cytochrome b n=1 Tax=Pontivivens ytuae TaxID=2789856 RepID=A0A7S9LPB7_9RHOB|nr:cytochrome b [Pontivivens ytuae]QPH52779.1 cytochrome b [Pontivivens ytuae]